MTTWNLDPIVFRSEPLGAETWQVQPSSVIEPSSLEVDSSNSWATFLLITDNEVVDIHSNIMLPSWLRAYNTGDNTYIEYLSSGELAPVPVVSESQIQILNDAKNNLFIDFAAIFGFFIFIKFLSDIFLEWRK